MSNTREPPILAAGLRHSERLAVTPFHTVPEVDDAWPGFRDMPPVFATAMMIGFIEQTCIEALRPYLTDEQRTVGTHVDISHVAPTPVGMSVTADVELIAVEERSLLFKVSCCDEAGLIGGGTHRRAIIDLNRFTRRLADKRLQAR
ncbi:thioesterase [Ensifer sp. MPMI2T]|nr:thioesterase [Ensifer sp. MPMI2T]